MTNGSHTALPNPWHPVGKGWVIHSDTYWLGCICRCMARTQPTQRSIGPAYVCHQCMGGPMSNGNLCKASLVYVSHDGQGTLWRLASLRQGRAGQGRDASTPSAACALRSTRPAVL